jgi:signal transduction histidine kinase
MAVALIGAFTLMGWALGISFLIRLSPGFVGMNPTTALSFVFSGLALWFQVRKKPGDTSRAAKMGLALAALVALIGALKLIQHFLGLGFQIDQLLLSSKLENSGDFSANVMTPNEGVCFLFSGVALLMFDVETRHEFRPAQALVLAQGLISLLALLGYGYRALSLYPIGANIPMPFGSAVAGALWMLGALAARPQAGVMLVVTSPTAGGAMARRLLPMAFLVPIILAALWLLGQKVGYFETEAGISMFAVLTIVIFTALIWWNAKLLFRADRERMESERHLAVQYKCTRVLSEANDLEQALPMILEAISQSIGWPLAVAWTVDEEANLLRCAALWHSPSMKPNEFIETTRGMTFAKGQGLPGRVWQSGESFWIEDVAQDENFPRARPAVGGGLHGGFGFPVRLGTDTLGVIECFSQRIERRDERLLEMLAAIGSQIGQFIERQRAEELLRQTSTELARSNTDLQQFAYVASHDLFEPLRMVVSFLQLLREHAAGKLDKESEEFITFALDGGRRMQALINDLLAYSRVDLRAQILEPTNCEHVLEAALGNLKVAIDETGAQINHQPLPTVRADIVQLIQLFQNLIGNAIKFHGKEPPRIDIDAREKDGEWLFTFRDKGIGIDPKHFARIFEIFQRLHTRQEYAGTGIGLAICKRIVERHGGRMWVESSPGNGSAFMFTLPVMNEG